MNLYPTFSEKYFKNGTLKPKIKKDSATPFTVLMFRKKKLGKKSQILFQVASDDFIVLISQTDDICFSFYINHFLFPSFFQKKSNCWREKKLGNKITYEHVKIY